MNAFSRLGGWLTLVTVVMALSACASVKTSQDPFEKFNRAMFQFNDAIDQVALQPAATAYQSLAPSFAQTGVANFFSNLGDVWTAVNNLLQGKLGDGMSDITRVGLNSTFGFAGLLDIGTEVGLPKHQEDFGQTLAEWGVPAGPYVVLPIFGSSTVRDSLVLPLDRQGDPWNYKRPVHSRNVGTALHFIDDRAAALGAASLIEDAALDKYEFVRDAYLQRRNGQINDGEPVHPALYEYFTTDKKDSRDVAAPIAAPE